MSHRFRPKLFAIALVVVASGRTAHAGTIFNANGLVGGSRWDAAPRTIGRARNERSLDGGLRYSLEGGSFAGFRDEFAWQGEVPSEADFQLAVEQAFLAWESVDPVSGLGTSISFVADLTTPVVGGGGFGTLNVNGAEIDLLGEDAGDAGTRAYSRFGGINSRVTLTSGTSNYPGTFAISGSDVTINSNPGARYTLDFFRRLLTHELGHSLGLGDVETNINGEFIDDNYDGTNSATARATLNNSWASLVNPFDPASSPLSTFSVPNGSPGIDSPGVDILMESQRLGIAAGNPVTNLVPLTNDDYGTRQFLYPFVVPEPSTLLLFVIAMILAGRQRLRDARLHGLTARATLFEPFVVFLFSTPRNLQCIVSHHRTHRTASQDEFRVISYEARVDSLLSAHCRTAKTCCGNRSIRRDNGPLRQRARWFFDIERDLTEPGEGTTGR